MIPTPLSHRPSAHRREDGNAFIVAIMFIAIFSIVVGACYVLSDETNRRATRETHFVSAEVAANAAFDVMYGRFSQWVNAHTGLTPSVLEAGVVGFTSNPTFPAITGAIDLSNAPGLSSYQVTGITLVPVLSNDDDTASLTFPSSLAATGSSAAIRAYQAAINKYYSIIPNIYEPQNYANALTYRASVTITPTAAATGSLYAPATTFTRYFQSSQVTPFAYNIFTEGSFEDKEWGQSFDSEASIYASVQVKMDHKGTIINGPVRYGGSFVDPDGNVNGVSDLVFQDPTTGATVDPYTSGLLRQVSKIEVVPDIQNVIAHNADGSRTASAETATATADDFSRRELIEPPANIATGDKAPDQIAKRRIYSQADVRLKISVNTTTTGSGKVTTATGTFYNLDGTVQAIYVGVPNSNATSTTWTASSGGTTVTAGVINAVNVNPVTSSTPFYDASRLSDTTSNYSGLPGQPTTANALNAVESVDVNVGSLTNLINNNPTAFATNTVYIWDDGASGQKNGVRLYNGGVLPAGSTLGDGTTTPSGLTVGSTNPVYIKGDYNTGTVLANASGQTTPNINSAVSGSVPVADTTGWNGGSMVSASDRALPGYTPKPSGVFGDSITTLSQTWSDALSNPKTNSGKTQNAVSTTYNTVMGFGSGDSNALQADDSFTNGQYANVNILETWNNARWNQLGEQMGLYHSLYNKHRAAPSWVSNGWAVIQNDYDANTAHLPLKWGYLVFTRGRLTRK